MLPVDIRPSDAEAQIIARYAIDRILEALQPNGPAPDVLGPRPDLVMAGQWADIARAALRGKPVLAWLVDEVRDGGLVTP